MGSGLPRGEGPSKSNVSMAFSDPQLDNSRAAIVPANLSDRGSVPGSLQPLPIRPTDAGMCIHRQERLHGLRLSRSSRCSSTASGWGSTGVYGEMIASGSRQAPRFNTAATTSPVVAKQASRMKQSWCPPTPGVASSRRPVIGKKKISGV